MIEVTLDSRYAPRSEQVSALALGLADAEEALQEFTAGQVDAVIDPIGRTYLLRNAQDLLQKREKRLQDLINCSADILTEVNRGGSILSQSEAVRRILGFQPAELIGTSIFSHAHPADLFSLFSAFLNVVEGFHESETVRFRHAAKDGSYHALEATLRGLRDPSSAVVVLSLRPIGEESVVLRSAALTETQELNPGAASSPSTDTPLAQPESKAEKQSTGSLHTFPDFIVLNDQGLVQRESSTLPRLLGQGTLLGRSVFEFVHPDDLRTLRSLFHQASQSVEYPTTFDAQFRHRMPDGTWSLVDATIGTLHSLVSTQIIIIFRDASHLRMAREEATRREATLTKASAAKDKFLATLSHELRTPLSPIFFCLTELEEDAQYAEARPIFAMIRRNLDMQARLLEELSYFTTVDQHKVRLRMEPIDLHEAIRFVVEICRGEIVERGVSVHLELQAANNIVIADSVRLQQIMWNLLKNAIKFSPEGGSISISSANRTDTGVMIAFADEGIGIKPELLPLVFDPFQQGDPSIRPLYGGLGLGLFIAKGLAEAQQAGLTVESAGEGQGATFRLSFATATQN